MGFPAYIGLQFSSVSEYGIGHSAKPMTTNAIGAVNFVWAVSEVECNNEASAPSLAQEMRWCSHTILKLFTQCTGTSVFCVRAFYFLFKHSHSPYGDGVAVNGNERPTNRAPIEREKKIYGISHVAACCIHDKIRFHLFSTFFRFYISSSSLTEMQ